MKHSVVLVPIIFWTGAACALTPNQWQYRQSIDVPTTGLVQVSLPLETSNLARPDLSDLRIIDSNEKEIPFLIDQPMPRPESTMAAQDFRAEIDSAKTRLLITTGTDLTIAGLMLETPVSANFIKAARVEGSNDQMKVSRSGSVAALIRRNPKLRTFVRSPPMARPTSWTRPRWRAPQTSSTSLSGWTTSRLPSTGRSNA